MRKGGRKKMTFPHHERRLFLPLLNKGFINVKSCFVFGSSPGAEQPWRAARTQQKILETRLTCVDVRSVLSKWHCPFLDRCAGIVLLSEEAWDNSTICFLYFCQWVNVSTDIPGLCTKMVKLWVQAGFIGELWLQYHHDTIMNYSKEWVNKCPPVSLSPFLQLCSNTA